MTYELHHADDGAALHYLRDAGWKILQKPYGGGHYDSRCRGGWWLFKGDEAQARAEQTRRWSKVLKEMGVA
jgi:hypothetical protein